MATEEQTAYDSFQDLYPAALIRGGQRLTISNRTVTKLSFYLCKIGSPTGDVTFTIRDLDDNILASKVWGDASDLPEGFDNATWKEVTLDTPVLVNEEVRILVEFSGTGDVANYVGFGFQYSNVKADEHHTFYSVYNSPHWADFETWDTAYKYTYIILAPTGTTDPATLIADIEATLNGTVTSDGGEACEVRFQYGLTAAYGTNTAWQPGKLTDDTFSQRIDGLTPDTEYHFRAQIKNSAGTANGADRTFTTKVFPTPFLRRVLRDVFGGGSDISAGNPLQAYIASQISTLLDSTTTPLGDGATYTGASKACDKYARIVGSIFTDHASTLYIDQSQDGTNWDYSSDFAVVANTGLAFSVEVVAPYCRMRVVNSAGAAQTVLRAYMRGRVI